MPTEKPRVTITMSSDQLSQIEDYRYGNKMKNQTQAILSLIERGFEALERSDSNSKLSTFKNKNAPALTAEAQNIAKRYQNLDTYGKSTVRAVMDEEETRIKEQADLELTLVNQEPKIIPLFVEPSAAGIATPTMGVDYELYELKQDEPQGAAFAVRIQGDSMEPYFPDQSIAFVNHDAMVDGDIGIFCVDGGTVCKQYHYDKMLGMTYLFSLNRSRSDADVIIPPSSGQSIVCQGRVITKRRFPIP